MDGRRQFGWSAAASVVAAGTERLAQVPRNGKRGGEGCTITQLIRYAQLGSATTQSLRLDAPVC